MQVGVASGHYDFILALDHNDQGVFRNFNFRKHIAVFQALLGNNHLGGSRQDFLVEIYVYFSFLPRLLRLGQL